MTAKILRLSPLDFHEMEYRILFTAKLSTLVWVQGKLPFTGKISQ